MATPSITDLLKYADLQMAAEAFLVSNDPPYALKSDLLAALKEGNNHASKFTELQATDFLATWEVVAQQPNTQTGFSGTLFKNKATVELVMSFRSTEFIDDAARDNQATNDLEVKETGFAWGQIRDMEAWYAQLSAEGGPLAGQAFNVTGYSLGGHLATVFNLLRQEKAQAKGGANPIVAAYTFNGAGVGQVKAGHTLGALVQQFAELSTPQADGSGHFSYANPELAAIYERVRAANLLGGAGDDQISGGAGADFMQGGAGADIYLIEAGGGTDLIEDTQDANVLLFKDRAGGLDPEGTLTPPDWNATYDAAKAAWVTSDGYVIRTHTLGTAITLAIYKDGDADNTVFLKDWSAGQFGISLSGEATAPQAPEITPMTVVTREDNNYVDLVRNNDAARLSRSFGKSTVVCFDGLGTIETDRQTLGGTQAAGQRNTWVAKLGDRLMTLQVLDSSTSATGKRAAYPEIDQKGPPAHVWMGLAAMNLNDSDKSTRKAHPTGAAHTPCKHHTKTRAMKPIPIGSNGLSGRTSNATRQGGMRRLA